MNKIASVGRALAMALFAASLLLQSCATRPSARKPAPEPSAARAERMIIPAEPESDRDASAVYRRAEDLYSQRRYEAAANEYLRFIGGAAPDDRLLDNAYFKTGMCWFEIGRYRDALFYFKKVAEKFPESEVYTEALINEGICHYQLNENKEAEKSFALAFPRIKTPGHKAYIYFYRANMAEDRGDFTGAMDLYVTSERIAEDEKLIEAARSKTERITRNFLGEKDLLRMTEEYSGSWAAKLAFDELANIYRRGGDQAAMARLDEKRRAQFPPPATAATVTQRREAERETRRPKIGAVVSLTGVGAQAGREIAQGIQLAFNSFHDLIREKGVQLIIKDSASEPVTAEMAVEDLARDDDTLAILGPVFSRELERVIKLADQYQIPIFSPSATAEGLAAQSPYVFRNTLTNSIEARKTAEFAVNDLGLKRFAVIYPDNMMGWEIFDAFKDSVESLGGSIEASERYNPVQTDFGEQIRNIGGMSDDDLRKIILSVAETFPNAEIETINQVLSEGYADKLTVPRVEKTGGLPLTPKNFLPGLAINYDAVYVPGVYDKVGLILPELEFYNIKGVTKISGKGANNPVLLKIAERYAEGLVFLDGFFKNSQSPHVKSFNRDYRLAFREEPTILSAQAYDAARIALSAIAHGATSRKAVADYFDRLMFFEGVSGETSMGPTGDADKSVFYLTVKDGKIVEYTPPPPEETAPDVPDVDEEAPPAENQETIPVQ